MNNNLNSVVFSFLIVMGIQVNGQTGSSSSMFSNPYRLPKLSLSSDWKQPIHTLTSAGNKFHLKETSSWFQTAKLEFYNSHYIRLRFPFKSDSLTGGRILFFNPVTTANQEPVYHHASTERS